jgi:hypothetical protein
VGLEKMSTIFKIVGGNKKREGMKGWRERKFQGEREY